MINLFDIINPNFFGVLAGRNRVSNFLLITEISNFFGSQIIVEREKLIDYIANQIKIMHIESVGEDDINDADYESRPFDVGQYSQKAKNFITYLEKRGWLERDRDEDFVDIVSRTDTFLEIYDSLIKLIQDETDAKEQSTALLSLYRNLKGFDYKNATSSIESIELSSKDLEKSILSINSKIKRFVDKTMADVSLDEKEILKRLTINYQKLSAYISFHNLFTKNNPNKYALTIKNKIFELTSEEKMIQLVEDYCKTKELNIENKDDVRKARTYIEDVFEQVVFQIENIEKSLQTIASRNHSYTSTSVDRIHFRLNNERDIKGDINNVLKLIKELPIEREIECEFNTYSFKHIDNKSLFTARSLSKIAPKQIPFTKREINIDAIEQARKLINQTEMFSMQSVNSFVDLQMGDKTELFASELTITSLDEFIKLMLIPVYSAGSNSIYKVSPPISEKFMCLDYEIEDYKIMRKKEKEL